MRYPIQATTFLGAYYAAGQLQTRLFPHFSPMKWYRNRDGQNGIGPNHYQGGHDLVAKFRLFEGDVAQAAAPSDYQAYLDLYQSGPLTKAELLNRMADGLPVDPNFAEKFRIKRRGKDKDDIFWSIGKIHGLENIAYLTEEEVASTGGDPMKLQALVDKVNDSEKPIDCKSHDEAVINVQ